VRESLERDYRQYFNCYILSKVGHVKLKDIGPRLLENFKVQLLGRDLSISTARRVIDGPFRAMIRDAKKFDGLLIDDAFAVLEWPETPRRNLIHLRKLNVMRSLLISDRKPVRENY
jgi:hypothetical protein